MLEVLQLDCQLQPGYFPRHSEAPGWGELDALLGQGSRFGNLSKVLINLIPHPEAEPGETVPYDQIVSFLRQNLPTLEAKGILCTVELDSLPSLLPTFDLYL